MSIGCSQNDATESANPCNLLKNIGKFPYFAFLHYFCGVGREKATDVNKAFCFKSELKFAKILNEGLKQPMLILCLYVGGAHFAHCPRIYSRRGNIVSSMFISLRRLAMPQFMDVRHKSHVFFIESLQAHSCRSMAIPKKRKTVNCGFY